MASSVFRKLPIRRLSIHGRALLSSHPLLRKPPPVLQDSCALPNPFRFIGFPSSPPPRALIRSPQVAEDEFHKLADETLHDLQEKFEEYGDMIQIHGFDIDYRNHVLTLKLGHMGTYVINKQTPNRQIWLSSPVSGTSRFDWDAASEGWVYRRTKQICCDFSKLS